MNDYISTCPGNSQGELTPHPVGSTRDEHKFILLMTFDHPSNQRLYAGFRMTTIIASWTADRIAAAASVF